MRYYRYFVKYESDRQICGSTDHLAGNAKSMTHAKRQIKAVKEQEAVYNPRNFRVYDTMTDDEISPVVYAC